MNHPDAGRLLRLVSEDAGMDIAGLLRELEAVPRKKYAIRQKLAPLKAELTMLQARYASKGRSPSFWDVERSMLLSQLKEEARQSYNRNPDLRTDPKTGREVKIELTDGRAADAAHADPRYREFVEKSKAEQRRMNEIGKQIGLLFDRLEVWKGREKFLLTKLEEAKALTYAYNSSARL